MSSTMLTLDRTVAEYYDEELEGTGQSIVLLPYYAVGGHDDICNHRDNDGVHDITPRFVYHSNRYDMEDFLFEPRLKKDTSALRTISQALGQLKFTMTAGAIPVACFHVDQIDNLPVLMKENLDILHPYQRATVYSVKSASQIRNNTFGATPGTAHALLCRLPIDGIHYPIRTRPLLLAMDSDLHYELHTKRCLALAPFSTPRANIIDFLTEGEIVDRVGTMELYGQSGVNKNNMPLDLISEFVQDVSTELNRLELPFVMKVQQASDGQGTWIIKNEEDRYNMQCVIAAICRYSTSQTTWENAHLRCASIMFTQYIPNSGVSYAVTFFLKRTGEVHFICCAEQNITDDNHWDGATIQYPKQEFLHGKFDSVMQDVAKYLNSRGYYGFVGIDVIEDYQRKLWVIDLNVRPPGSLILGLVKRFMKQRSFEMAQLISAMKVRVSKKQFIGLYGGEIDEGRIIIHAWFRDEVKKEDWASVIVSGENLERMGELVELVGRIGTSNSGEKGLGGQT